MRSKREGVVGAEGLRYEVSRNELWPAETGPPKEDCVEAKPKEVKLLRRRSELTEFADMLEPKMLF